MTSIVNWLPVKTGICFVETTERSVYVSLAGRLFSLTSLTTRYYYNQDKWDDFDDTKGGTGLSISPNLPSQT
jgi:hypothetical protein